MKNNSFETLKKVTKDYLNVDAYGLDDLSHWCKNTNVPSGISLRQQFQQELQYALPHEGTVTPELYERWTYEDLED